MPDKPNQAGAATLPGKEGASQDGNLIGKIKKLEADNKKLSGQLEEAGTARQTAEEEATWAKTLGGDVPEEVRNQIFKANLEVTTRGSEIDKREAAVKQSELEIEAKRLTIEHTLGEADLEGCETVEAMNLKSLEVVNTRLTEQVEEANKSKPPGYEFTPSVAGGVSPADMSEEQFEAHIAGLKAEAVKSSRS